jgi:antirestriction protein
MSDKKTIIKNFQSMKPSIVFKQLDYSKLPKEVRDKMKGDLSGVSDDTLDLQFEQSTFKRWIETFADLYPAAFGIKEDAKVVSIAPVAKVEPVVKAETIVVAEEKPVDTSELETKIKDLETRLSVVNKMILKQPLKKTELKIRVKTIEKMIAKFKEELKNTKTASKKKVLKKSLGGFLFGALGGFIAGQLVDLKLTRKKVRFDLGGTLEGDKKYQYSVTYQTITPESAENGDFDDSGFEVEKTIDELQDILQEAVNRYYIHEPSSTKNGKPVSGTWWSSVSPNTDRDYFEKGIEKYYSLHVSNIDGTELSDEEAQLITNKLKEGRKLHWDEEDKDWYKDGGEIHSKDTDGTLVFKADTKGGKYSIEVRQDSNIHGVYYSVNDYTNGSLRGVGTQSNKELLMHKLIDTILGSKGIDGINYIISVDELGVKEYLPASEKIWNIYNSPEFREWFKKQNETLTEEQKQSISEELKNKTIKYVRDNGYKENDSTIGTFFQLFRKERLIKDFYESKGMVMLKDGGELKKIIKFASLSSKINGYDNIVYEDENGLSFARKAEFERGISPNAKKLALIQSNGEVVKYENGGDVTRKVYSYKTFKDNGIDVFKYLRDEKGDNPHEYTLDVVISKVKKDKDVLIPNLKLKYPELLLLQGYDADMKEKFDVELFACKIYSIFGQPTEKEKEICEEKLSKSYRKTYDGYKKLKNGGDVQTQEWLSNMNQERLNELKALRAEIEETMAEDFVETTGGSGRTKAQILADFDSSIAVRENKNFENGGGVYSIPYDTETTGVFKLVADGVNTTIRLAGAEKNDSDTYSFYQFDTDRNDEIGSIIVNNRAIDKLSKGVTVIGTGSKNGIKYKITRVSNVFENGGGVGNVESEINDLYSKSNFINDSFNWKMKLLEMLQDRSIEAYNVYQSLNANQKEEVLQALFEADNDMGSDGDGELSTSKENLEILLEDAKNGNKYSNGGGVSKWKFNVGDKVMLTPLTFFSKKGFERYDLTKPVTIVGRKKVALNTDGEYRLDNTTINNEYFIKVFDGEGGLPIVTAKENELTLVAKYSNGGGIGKAIVKYDKNLKMWCVIDSNGKPIEEFVNKHNAVELANRLNKKNEYANGGGVGEVMTRGEIENKIDGLKLRIAKEKKRISAYETTQRGKYNKLWEEKIVPLKKELDNLSELWGKSKYANGGGVEDNKMSLIVLPKDKSYFDEVLKRASIKTYKIEKGSFDYVYHFYDTKDRERAFGYLHTLFANGGGIGKAIENLHSKASSSTTPRGKNKLKIPSNEMSFRAEEQKSWGADKIKFYDSYVDAHNKIQDLKEELKKAKLRKDKELIKSLELRIAANEYAKKTSKEYFDKYSDGGSVGEDNYNLLYNFVDEKMIEGDEEAERMINEKGYSLTYDELYNFVDEKMIEGDSDAKNILNKINKFNNGGGVGQSIRGFKVGDTFYRTPSTSGDTRYYKITSIDNFYVKADDYDYVRNGTDVNTGRKSSFTTGSFGYKVDEHEISRYERGDLSYAKGGGLSSDNTPKVYIADLAAYNEGSLVGEWLDLSEFGSGEEVMEKISELLKQWSEEAGEEREEYSVHDMENFPKQMYSEGMGESSFQKVIDYWEAINGTDYPMEVVEEFASLTGEDVTDAVSKMKDAYYGKFDSVDDFAREYVDSVGGIEGVSNPERYIDVSETDKRIVASEQADSDVANMSDDDVLERADLKETYDNFIERADELAEDEELDDDDRTRTLESEFGYDDSDDILEEAKEKVREEIESEWEKGLRDPYNFLVEEQGLYDSSSIMKANFIMFDYKKFGKDLEYDYYTIEHDGDVYVFSQNYKKGGSLSSSRSLGVSIEKIEIDIPEFRPEKLKEQTKTNKKPKTMAKKSAGSNKNKERMNMIQSVAKKIWAEGKLKKYSEAVSLAAKQLKKEKKL